MYKVGDFVYFKDYSMDPDFDDKFGYGTIIEIKELPKSFQEGTETFAIIQVKYFEDGTPCEWDSKEVIKLCMLDPAQTAVERHERELYRQLDNMKDIRKEFTDV